MGLTCTGGKHHEDVLIMQFVEKILITIDETTKPRPRVPPGVLSGTSENQSIKAHGGRRIKTVDFIATVPYDCVKKLKIPRQKTCV